MSELVKVNSSYATVQRSMGQDDDFVEHIVMFEGRTRLRSVMIMDMSYQATVGSESFIEFKDSVDDGMATGESMLKLYPNLMSAFLWVFNGKALFVELPGDGILFGTGILCTLSMTDIDADGIKSMGVTALYG